MTILQSGIAQAAAGGGGYQIARSLRFNSADSAYLNRTPASAGNRRTWTWSAWVKKSRNGEFFTMLEANYPSTPWNVFGFDDTDKLSFDTTAGVSAGWATTAVFRDLSAWYHIVFVLDTTSATSTMNGSSTDRIRTYVNGTQLVLSGGSVPTQNSDLSINNTIAHYIGGYGVPRYSNCYMADIRFIDGQALDPTSFGEFDANTGVWSPITYSGTYGTNGFWLKFDDNSNNTAATLGKDSSGNSNNWTPNNFSVTAGVGNDSLVDSPTNYGTDTGAGGEVRGNYCTFNPLANGGVTLSNGNLTSTFGAAQKSVLSTIGVSSGKWYWESTLTTVGSDTQVGIANSTSVLGNYLGQNADGWSVVTFNGNRLNNSSQSSYGSAFSNGDVAMFALDMDSGKWWVGKNGTWFSSGDPVAGTNFAHSGLTGVMFPALGCFATDGNHSINFGQRAFAYTAPSGFKALTTTNLPTPAIGATSTTLANKNFDVATYTGTGSSLSITSLAFQPDLAWIKGRSGATDHAIYDAVRGVQVDLVSNSNGAETTQTQGVTAFGSTGFTVGTLAKLNTSSATYVGWAFKGGGTAVTNTSGSISSQVSANPTAGISVVTYTGNGSAVTIGHGLGVAPAMVMVKRRDNVSDWAVYHNKLPDATYYLYLNSTAGQAVFSGFWNNTAPTSSVINIGSTLSSSGGTYVAYAFAEVPGFSKFGSYTGNGSTDGPFVYCGFRPKFVLIKNTDAGTEAWGIIDSARNTYNVSTGRLFPNLSNAESTGDTTLDFLSNGFKLRSTDALSNASRAYIFVAFAETPFQYSRAR